VSQPISAVLRHLREAAGPSADLPDEALLERFARLGDEAAFATLLRRHGPMVLGICRRVLRNSADSEDAFQATFLVLVRKAKCLGKGDRIGPWLSGVAYRTAVHARTDRDRRHAHERRAEARASEPAPEVDEAGMRAALDREIQALPEKYRVPVVLCYLQGMTYEDAARQLGVPLGTVATRLARARERLRSRLAARGLCPCATVLASVLADNAPVVPGHLLADTLRAGPLVGGGKVAAGAIAPSVALLAEGVVQGMFLSKVKVTLALVLVLALLAGASALARRGPAAAPPAPSRGARGAAASPEKGDKTGRRKPELDKKPEVSFLKRLRVRDQDIEAGIVPAKTEVVEGEPIRAALTVKNLSDKPFRFWFGGDYRGVGRHQRFKITALDSRGTLLPDPKAKWKGGDMGGLGSVRGPDAGRSHEIAVDVEQYRIFSGPGTYTITCRFDLEVPEGGELRGACVKAPVQTTWTLTILPRSGANVRRVLPSLVQQVKRAQGPEAATAAVVEVASFGREWAVPELAALANGRDRPERVAALFALGNLPLLSGGAASKASRDEALRGPIAEALVGKWTDRAVGALLARLRQEKSPTARCSLLVALGNTRSPQALPPLEQALSDRSPAVRRAAVRALVLCGGRRAIELLERCAREDLPTREAAVHGLVEIHRRPLRPEWVLPVLRAGRGFPQRGTNSAWAMEMLRAHLGKDAGPLLIASVDFQSPSPRALYNHDLVRHLTAIPGAPKVKWHHHAIADSTPAQVEQNRRALAELWAWLARHERERRRPERIARPIRLLGNEDFAEREKGARALEALGASAFEALLVTAALSDDLEVRRRAERVMEALRRRWGDG
jgi:RNA polymerase sigma factor (sigma-70 family)